MALLQVRDFPQELYTTLSALAQSENRSITQQTTYMLGQALNADQNHNVFRRKRALQNLSGIKLNDKESGSPMDYTSIIRSSRDREDGFLS